ncbi:hypothetical protein ADUPG1_011393 [Aduncisulcus paluster]|uniref:RING-type domain-containing protein n=1 Tax=Aduncisulcus paluster TaxID=2918883 RepID=A0ABQ5JVF5_9EUKA|nr:hypothetical protein ADUPG1_011393 [Aduncisulcus paluster]
MPTVCFEGIDPDAFITEEGHQRAIELQCPICLTVNLDMVKTSCNHMFCRNCFHKIWRYPSISCPMCRKKVKSYRNVSIRSELCTITAKCPNHIHGCNVIDCIPALEHHLITCLGVQTEIDPECLVFLRETSDPGSCQNNFVKFQKKGLWLSSLYILFVSLPFLVIGLVPSKYFFGAFNLTTWGMFSLALVGSLASLMLTFGFQYKRGSITLESAGMMIIRYFTTFCGISLLSIVSYIGIHTIFLSDDEIDTCKIPILEWMRQTKVAPYYIPYVFFFSPTLLFLSILYVITIVSHLAVGANKKLLMVVITWLPIQIIHLTCFILYHFYVQFNFISGISWYSIILNFQTIGMGAFCVLLVIAAPLACVGLASAISDMFNATSSGDGTRPDVDSVIAQKKTDALRAIVSHAIDIALREGKTRKEKGEKITEELRKYDVHSATQKLHLIQSECKRKSIQKPLEALEGLALSEVALLGAMTFLSNLGLILAYFLVLNIVLVIVGKLDIHTYFRSLYYWFAGVSPQPPYDLSTV